MIKRIHKIKNVGKFIDCIPNGGHPFLDKTIIFGTNTAGKSTLTAILRSLKTNNPDLIIGRNTFGSNGEQKVDLEFDISQSSKHYIFENSKWNEVNKNIWIFDKTFIADNIFDGECITFEHQKNLHQIIIGEEGAKLKIEIDELQRKSEEITRYKQNKTFELQRHFRNIDITKFSKIEKDVDVDGKVKEKEEEIKFEKEKIEIKKLLEKNIFITSFAKVKTIISQTFESKQKEIEDHINKHWKDPNSPKAFLFQGLERLKEKPNEGQRNCVFCGQGMEDDAEKLIIAYSELFREEYEKLQKEIKDMGNRFIEWDVVTAIENEMSKFKSYGIKISLSEETIEKIRIAKSELNRKIEQKKEDLSLPTDFTIDKDFQTIETEFLNIARFLEDIQKEKLQHTEIDRTQELKNGLERLKLQKERYEPKWETFVSDYLKSEKDAKLIRSLRDKKRDELDQYSKSIFDEHKGSINYFLSEMGADFCIDDFQPIKKLVGQSERIFAIKFFDNYSVKIYEQRENLPNFSNTLSDSDKRVLALAFFLSLLSHDKKLNEKIIIFDDPISSFDCERRRKTIHLLADICYRLNNSGENITLKPCQTIILTHEEIFLSKLIGTEEFSQAKTLQIVPDGIENRNKKSKIEYFDIKEFLVSTEIKYLEELKAENENNNISEDFDKKSRKVLEHIFKNKYHLQFKTLSPIASVRSFISTLRELKINNFDNEDKYKFFDRVCRDLNIELHAGESNNSDGDKQSILKEFFACIPQI